MYTILYNLHYTIYIIHTIHTYTAHMYRNLEFTLSGILN